MNAKPIDIPAGVIIAQQELAQSLDEEKSFEVLSEDMALATPRSGTESKCKDRHLQVDKLKHSNDQTVEKNFDLTSAKSLWDSKFVKALKRLLLTMSIIWVNPDTVGRTTKGTHHINTQNAQPIALPLRRIAWIEKDKIKQEVDKMKQQGIIEDSESP